jgi:FkbM family methyltransferase
MLACNKRKGCSMSNMRKVKINGQWEIFLTEARADRPEWIIENGGWEVARLESMNKNLSFKDTLYYVGSEVGDMAGLCAIWGAEMLMFEPNPKVWSSTKSIWEANNIPTPLTFEGFASDVTQTLGEKVRRGFPKCADTQIEAAHGFKELDKEADNYPQIKIDDIWVNGDIVPPTAIALDVEGAEGRVLRGAEQTLIKYHPKIWLSLHPEFLHEQYGEWGAELRKWIIDLGYEETFLEYPLHEVHLYYEAKS